MEQLFRSYARSLPWLLLIYLALYFFELASFPLSIDEETAAFRSDPSVWISQGRWGAYLIELLVLPHPAIPVVAPAIFGLSCVLAFILIVDVSTGSQPVAPLQYLTFPVFCGYPTWYFISEFYSNLAGTGIALTLSAAAVWITQNGSAKSRTHFAVPVAALMAAISIGIYQSFLFVVLAMLFGVVLLQIINGLRRDFWSDIAVGLVAIGVGVVIHLTVDKVTRLAFPKENMYFDSLWKIDQLFSSPLSVLKRILGIIGNAYGIIGNDFGVSLWAAAIVVALGLLALVRLSRGHSARQKLFLMLASVIVILSPFTLLIVTGGLLPYRSFVGVPFAVWLLATLALNTGNCKQRIVSIVAVALLVFQTFVIANQFQASHYFSSRKDLLLAGAITDRIFSLQEFDASKSYFLALYGNIPFRTTAFPQPKTSTIGRSFFEWDGGNAGRISLFLRLFGYPRLLPQTPEIENKVIRTLARMPVFPAIGSVKIEDNVVLLRLGAEASWRNMQAIRRAEKLSISPRSSD